MSKIAALIAVLALAVPAVAAARPLQDYRSPDAKPATTTQDFRSPDAKSPLTTPQPAFSQDLRSPDAGRFGAFQPALPTESADSSGSFDWGYLAGVVAALILLAGWVVTQRRRRHGLAIGS
jgi:hypothetical protein